MNLHVGAQPSFGGDGRRIKLLLAGRRGDHDPYVQFSHGVRGALSLLENVPGFSILANNSLLTAAVDLESLKVEDAKTSSYCAVTTGAGGLPCAPQTGMLGFCTRTSSHSSC
jgi:hypothetical protein